MWSLILRATKLHESIFNWKQLVTSGCSSYVVQHVEWWSFSQRLLLRITSFLGGCRHAVKAWCWSFLIENVVFLGWFGVPESVNGLVIHAVMSAGFLDIVK